MLKIVRNRRYGFTLIELAIVLSIVGLLFVGLWRILAGGNQQMRDQSAAAEQVQLINALQAFFGSTGAGGGQGFLAAIPSSTTALLKLPSSLADAAGSGTCAGDGNMTGNTNGTNTSQLCNFLPAGFWTGTVNSYGQQYVVRVLKDSTPAGTAPNTFSFMIVGTGGDTIPDTSGGRISAGIGNDGGFIYSNNVCGAPTTTACGAYGTWSTPVATYGFGAQAGGQVASRSYSAAGSNNSPWLSRQFLTGDSLTSPYWNTMQTDAFLGGKTLWLGSNNTLTTGGSTGANGGINLQGGFIQGTATSTIALTANGVTTSPMLVLNGSNGGASTSFSLLTASNGCSITSVNPYASAPAGCQYSMSTDNLLATGTIVANNLYALTFLYQPSDIRFKSDIHPIMNSLDDIMKLRPVSFTLKTNGKKSMGVIAQELEKVYPQLVTQQGEGMKFVNYDGLIGPLIGAVQELKKENDELRTQLHTQEQREKALEKKMDSKSE